MGGTPSLPPYPGATPPSSPSAPTLPVLHNPGLAPLVQIDRIGLPALPATAFLSLPTLTRVTLTQALITAVVPAIFVLATTDGEGTAGAGLPGAPGVPNGTDAGTSSPGGSGSSNGGGAVRYGGRATGPSPLPLLAEDAAYPVPAPPVQENLPAEIDVQPAERQTNVVCDPVDRPGVLAFANLMATTYDRAYYSTFRSCIDLKSEHYDGRALDWALNAFDPGDRRIGDSVALWLTDNDGEMAKRFGIQSIIWNAHVWSPETGVWQGYSGQSAHTDHMHVSFTWDGAQMRTSWWTGVAVSTPDLGPCHIVQDTYAAIPAAPRYQACDAEALWATYTGYDRVRPGNTGAGVGLLQPLLDVPQTGVLDEPTRAALIAWQAGQGVPQTGVLDQLTYAAALGYELPALPESALAVAIPDYATTRYTPYLRTTLREGDTGEGVKVLQKAIGAKVDGVYGKQTQSKLDRFVSKRPVLAGTTHATPLLWTYLERRGAPTLIFRYQSLERGAESNSIGAVRVLQDHLGVETDGKFGPITEQAVKDEQSAAGLEPTGIVDGPTWAAIDKGRGLTRFHAELEAKAKAEKSVEAAATVVSRTAGEDDGKTESTQAGPTDAKGTGKKSGDQAADDRAPGAAADADADARPAASTSVVQRGDRAQR